MRETLPRVVNARGGPAAGGERRRRRPRQDRAALHDRVQRRDPRSDDRVRAGGDVRSRSAMAVAGPGIWPSRWRVVSVLIACQGWDQTPPAAPAYQRTVQPALAPSRDLHARVAALDPSASCQSADYQHSKPVCNPSSKPSSLCGGGWRTRTFMAASFEASCAASLRWTWCASRM